MGKWRCRKKFQAEEENVGKPVTCGGDGQREAVGEKTPIGYG